MRRSSVLILAACLLVSATCANADTITLDVTSAYSELVLTASNADVTKQYAPVTTDPLTTSITGTIAVPNCTFVYQCIPDYPPSVKVPSNVSATGIVNLQPNPNVTALASQAGQGEASADASFVYSFIPTYTGQFGVENGVKLYVDINATGYITTPFIGTDNGASIYFGGTPLAYITCSPGSCTNSFSIATPETLLTGTEYTISIEALVTSGAAFPDYQYGYVDPTITFAPGFDANGFALVFSPGVGNSPSTPLPTALPLFATGLGGLGLLGWRRKRKKQWFAA